MTLHQRVRFDQRGSGTVLIVAIMALLLTLGAAATVVGGYGVASHRAKAAADLAAVSGASATATGDDPCRAARRVAVANHAQLDDCQLTGDQQDFVVAVKVSIQLKPVWPGLPKVVTTEAYAGSVP